MFYQILTVWLLRADWTMPDSSLPFRIDCTREFWLGSSSSSFLSSDHSCSSFSSLLQPPWRRASRIIALDASTSAAMNGNLKGAKIRFMEKVNLLVSLVVVVRVAGSLNWVLDQLLECSALTNEFDQFRDGTAAAKHDEFFFFKQKFLNGTSFLLVQKLVDFHVASIVNEIKVK